jgi:outer membrane lipoprotein-sorting protein
MAQHGPGEKLMSSKNLFALIVTAVCFLSGGASADITVDQALASITAQMADLKSVQVDFVQEKKMAVFAAPITLSGTLFWARPDSFAWHTDSPVKYAIILKDGIARQWDGDRNTTQEFKMNANPVMRVASQQLQRWFSGNYQQLASEYDVSVVSREPMVLSCAPHPNSPEAGFITRVTLRFRQDLRYIDTISIDEVSGDQTNIHFDNARLNETIPPDAWRAGAVRTHG